MATMAIAVLAASRFMVQHESAEKMKTVENAMIALVPFSFSHQSFPDILHFPRYVFSFTRWVAIAFALSDLLKCHLSWTPIRCQKSQFGAA
jgi:hypothetical protein